MKQTSLGFVFDASQIDPEQGIGHLPVGRHIVEIVDSEIRQNSGNTGGFLQLTLSVVDGVNQGKQGSMILNLWHSSEQAVQIAKRTLSAICHATGQFVVNDSRLLHGLQFMVDVELDSREEQANKGYTQVKRVLNLDGSTPKLGQQVKQPAATESAMPWAATQPASNAFTPAQTQPAQPAAESKQTTFPSPQ